MRLSFTSSSEFWSVLKQGGSGCGTQAHRCKPHLQTGQDSETKRPRPPSEAPFPNPQCPCFPPLKFHLQGQASVYRRENLFLKALIVLAIIGAISVKREIREWFQMCAVQTHPTKPHYSRLCMTKWIRAGAICSSPIKAATSWAPAGCSISNSPTKTHRAWATWPRLYSNGRTGIQSSPDSIGHSEPSFSSTSPISKPVKSTPFEPPSV